MLVVCDETNNDMPIYGNDDMSDESKRFSKNFNKLI